MNGRTFVDANVLIYAHDADAKEKRERAKSVLRDLWIEHTGILSVQVLQEFYVTVTRKLARPMSNPAARLVVDSYASWCVGTTPADISSAFRIEDISKISFWDALIVASALKSGATRILSEDLNPGQSIAGILVQNPFAVAG